MLAVSGDSVLPAKLLKELLKRVKAVQIPILVTITTEKDTVVFLNNAMWELRGEDRALLYMLLNKTVLEELACIQK